MKRSVKYILSLFVIAICVAISFAFAQNSKASALASSGEDYLIWANIEDRTATTNDGITISITEASETNLVSYLTISVTDWTDIQSFTIKRIVSSYAQTVQKDDTNTTCIFDNDNETLDIGDIPTDPTTFYFCQSGGYVVIYQINDETKAIYAENDFTRTVDLHAISASNNAQIYINANFENETANVIVAPNGNSVLTIGSYNINLYEAAFSADIVNTNTTTTLSIEQKSNNSTLYSADFEAYCNFPEIEYLNGSTAITDVFNGYTGTMPNTNDILYFNENVTPTPNYTGINEELFKKRFVFVSNTLSPTSNIINSHFELIGDETSSFMAKLHVVFTNPSNNITLRLGSNTESAPTYQNLTSVTPTIYVSSNVYPIATDAEYKVESNINNNTTDAIQNVVVYGYLQSDNTKSVVFAYGLKIYHYTAASATISYTTSANQVNIQKEAGISIPIDLVVINTQTGERFTYYDLYQNVIGTDVSIGFNGSAAYRVIITYRNSALQDQQDDGFSHRSFLFNTTGISISLISENKNILNGQITNNPVRITVSGVEEYSVYHNSKLEGTYSTPTIFGQIGYYTVVYGENEVSFAIVTTEEIASYTLSEKQNSTLVSITKGEDTIDIENLKKLTESGTYTLTYALNTTNNVTINGEQKTLLSTTNYAYNIVISAPYFNVSANVKNGTRSAKNVVINNITANGNSTVKITHNKKTTTYTVEQFNKLSASKRTFSKSGSYQILITDESGAEYIFSFQKYYSLGIGLILLIAIFAILAIIGIILLVRLRLKAKVK